MSLTGFVQIIELEKGTAMLRVTSPVGTGLLLFEKGSLVGAQVGDLEGDAAALVIFRWRNTTHEEVSISEIPRTVILSLQEALLEAARLDDEAGTGTSQPRGWEVLSIAPERTREVKVANIEVSMKNSLKIGGAMGAALVDYNSGMCLGSTGNPGFDLELAAAGNAEVVRAKKSIRDKLGLKDKIEDILITLTGQYHLIRMVGTSMFIYLVLDRSKANLALARKELELVEKGLDVDRE